MTDLPESQLGRQAQVEYYQQLEQDGLNMVRYARKRLGWLAMGVDMPIDTESITQMLTEARDDSSI